MSNSSYTPEKADKTSKHRSRAPSPGVRHHTPRGTRGEHTPPLAPHHQTTLRHFWKWARIFRCRRNGRAPWRHAFHSDAAVTPPKVQLRGRFYSPNSGRTSRPREPRDWTRPCPDRRRAAAGEEEFAPAVAGGNRRGHPSLDAGWPNGGEAGTDSDRYPLKLRPWRGTHRIVKPAPSGPSGRRCRYRMTTTRTSLAVSSPRGVVLPAASAAPRAGQVVRVRKRPQASSAAGSSSSSGSLVAPPSQQHKQQQQQQKKKEKKKKKKRKVSVESPSLGSSLSAAGGGGSSKAAALQQQQKKQKRSEYKRKYMKNYMKTKRGGVARSTKVKCDSCGKSFHAFGINTHKRFCYTGSTSSKKTNEGPKKKKRRKKKSAAAAAGGEGPVSAALAAAAARAKSAAESAAKAAAAAQAATAAVSARLAARQRRQSLRRHQRVTRNKTRGGTQYKVV